MKSNLQCYCLLNCQIFQFNNVVLANFKDFILEKKAGVVPNWVPTICRNPKIDYSIILKRVL